MPQVITYTNAEPGRDDELSDWYDNVHRPDALAVPGVIAMRRLRARAGDGAAAHRYLAVYDVEGDVDEVVAEIRRRIGSGQMTLSPALDTSTMTLVTYDEI